MGQRGSGKLLKMPLNRKKNVITHKKNVKKNKPEEDAVRKLKINMLWTIMAPGNKVSPVTKLQWWNCY